MLTIKYLISPKLGHKFCCFSAFHIFFFFSPRSWTSEILINFHLCFICYSHQCCPKLYAFPQQSYFRPFLGAEFQNHYCSSQMQASASLFPIFFLSKHCHCAWHIMYSWKDMLKRIHHSSKEPKKKCYYRDKTVRHIAETKEQWLWREVGTYFGGGNFYYSLTTYWPISVTFIWQVLENLLRIFYLLEMKLLPFFG